MSIAQPRQFPHAMLPRAQHDERARQDFVRSYKVHVLSGLGPGNRTVYDRKVKPVLDRQGNAKNGRTIAPAMAREPFWQAWSSLNRTSQEMMWESLSEPAFRELPRMMSAARSLKTRQTGGSLTLDPQEPVPRYIAAVDIHGQPGGYGLELQPDDVYAGALYDLSAFHYSLGGLGPHGADPGDSTVVFLRRRYPGFTPHRILDIGCSVGASTLPLKDAWPDADVQAIDIAPAFLRYADARTRDLGRAVHFSQQNAEATKFPDGHFDLIVSHLFFHETSAAAVRAIMAECRRLLAPGGLMLHSDVPEANRFWPDAYDRWWRDWTTHFNAEPFRSTLRGIDLGAVAVKAGFARDKVYETKIPSARAEQTYKSTHGYGAEWHIVVAEG
jgi:SAM-dependent methyltransferase